MCGQLICVLSQVDVSTTNMCIISGGYVVNKYVYYLMKDVWSTNMCIISGGCVDNKYVYYLRGMCG